MIGIKLLLLNCNTRNNLYAKMIYDSFQNTIYNMYLQILYI